MDIEGVLSRIRKSHEQTIIMALVDDIEKHKNDWTDEVMIRSIYFLSYWLYISDDTENALACANLLMQAGDLHNHVIWACVENAFILCTYIYSKQKNSEYQNQYWEKVLNLNFGAGVSESRIRITKKRWDRNLTTGDLFETYESQEKAAKLHNNFRGMVYNRFDTLKILFWMFLMGGSEKYPIEKIEQLIEERKIFLQENIDNAEVSDFV